MTLSIAARPFLQGLLIVAAAYIAVAAYAFVRGPETLTFLEEHLASSSALIERIAPPAEAPHVEPLPTLDIDQKIITPPAPVAEIEAPAVPKAAEDVTSPIDATALPVAPVDGLYEDSATGKLPKKGPTGETPFETYRHPFKITGTPVIALMVSDYGLSEAASLKALEVLPANISFMVSSYSGDPEKWAADARKAGHETWMSVNFETATYPHSDPGPQALLANASLKYNEDRLKWNLSRATGYAGVGGGTDYIFESAASILQPLVKFIYNRGLGFFEMNPDVSPMIETIAVNAQAPYAKADLVVNDGMSQENPFKQLERTAQERGFAIGIIKPYGASFEAIKMWLDTLEAKGIQLAPVSAVAAIPLSGPAESEEKVEMPAPAEAPAHE